MLEDKLTNLPSPVARPDAWEDCWSRWPRQWQSLCCLFLKRVASKEQAFVDDCRRFGLPLVNSEKQDDGIDIQCPHCPRMFRSQAALFGHIKSHGVMNPLRDRLQGNVCPVCAVDFHQRARLRRHFKDGAPGCVLAFRTGALPLLSVAQAELADEEERAQNRVSRAEGRRIDHGLPCLPPD